MTASLYFVRHYLSTSNVSMFHIQTGALCRTEIIRSAVILHIESKNLGVQEVTQTKLGKHKHKNCNILCSNEVSATLTKYCQEMFFLPRKVFLSPPLSLLE